MRKTLVDIVAPRTILRSIACMITMHFLIDFLLQGLPLCSEARFCEYGDGLEQEQWEP